MGNVPACGGLYEMCGDPECSCNPVDCARAVTSVPDGGAIMVSGTKMTKTLRDAELTFRFDRYHLLKSECGITVSLQSGHMVMVVPATHRFRARAYVRTVTWTLCGSLCGEGLCGDLLRLGREPWWYGTVPNRSNAVRAIATETDCVFVAWVKSEWHVPSTCMVHVSPDGVRKHRLLLRDNAACKSLMEVMAAFPSKIAAPLSARRNPAAAQAEDLGEVSAQMIDGEVFFLARFFPHGPG